MAQSATTVTPDGPTPPTNFGSGQVGLRPPTAASPYLDDGTAGTNTVFAAVSSGTAFEGLGTETLYTAPGSLAYAPTQSVSCLGTYTVVPNQQHASSLSPATNPTLTNINPTTTASAVGTQLQTITGVGFTRQSVIWVNNVPQVTTFVSSTSLTATVTKKTSAGTWPVFVITGGVVNTTTATWTFT